jgi:hypothetical protein
VAGDALEITHQPGRLLLKVPASEVEILSPMLRRLAEVVVLRVKGELVAVEFDFVYRRKRFLSSRQRGFLLAMRAVFLASSITYLPAVRLGRRLAAEFTAALVAAGAREKAAAQG